MKAIVHSTILIIMFLIALGCNQKNSYPRNKYLEMKTRPSEKLAKENKTAQKRTIKAYKRMIKLNKRNANR